MLMRPIYCFESNVLFIHDLMIIRLLIIDLVSEDACYSDGTLVFFKNHTKGLFTIFTSIYAIVL